MNTNDEQNPLDQATAARLHRLSTMPVDTSALERTLRAAISPPSKRSMWRAWPARAIAASLLIASLVLAVMLTASSGSVLASPAQMAQMHEDLVSGRLPSMQADSVEAANKMLAAQSPASPQVPSLPPEHVMACCMQSVKNKKVACVLLKEGMEGIPVSMMVANASDMRLPVAPTRTFNGETYYVQSSGLLNMVMMKREGRWVCLIGQVAVERMMELAGKLRF